MSKQSYMELLPCPFCGAKATIEEILVGGDVRFSVGCDSAEEVACMGYQNFTTFARRGDAITAWNKRAPLPQSFKFLEAIRNGELKDFSIDPSNPATAYDPMDIYSDSGTRVRFTGYGGYASQQKKARQFLEVGGIYTVQRTEVGSCHTDVFFKEFPKEAFNSVMFSEVEDS